MSENASPLLTLPEFASELGVTYVVAKGLMDKPDAPSPDVVLGNRRAWRKDALQEYISRRYSFVIDFLDYAPRKWLAGAIKAEADRMYDNGYRDGYRDAEQAG